MDLSLIIPAFNEERRIGPTLQRVREYLRARGGSYEVIVVDDGSTDGTAQAVRAAGASDLRLIELGANRGKGAAVREGMLTATGEIRIFSDADLSTPIAELEKIVAELHAGADVCVGSRALDVRTVKVHQPWYREMMGKIFNRMVRLVAVPGIFDTQCGFKAFTARAATGVFASAKIDRFSFDVEIIFLARRLGYLVRETPVEWRNDRRSTVSPLADAARMFFDLLAIRWIHRRG